MRREIAFISTFLPRKCGIAIFTSDLIGAIEKAGQWKCHVIAMSDEVKKYDYNEKVWFEIDQFDIDSYIESAQKINQSEISAVMIEHEYGIYGGEDGEYILKLVENLEKPYLVTYHTILPEPTLKQYEVLDKLCKKAIKVIVMAKHGAELLAQVFNLEEAKIEVIPHGIPDLRKTSNEIAKKKYNL